MGKPSMVCQPLDHPECLSLEEEKPVLFFLNHIFCFLYCIFLKLTMMEVSCIEHRALLVCDKCSVIDYILSLAIMHSVFSEISILNGSFIITSFKKLTL